MATAIPENVCAFTIAEVLQATGGKAYDVANDDSVRGVFIDSRRARPGGLFVAIEGERVDAHRFLPQVVATGSVCIVRAGRVAELRELGGLGDLGQAGPFPRIEVADTLVALGQLASFHRQRWGGCVVGITGSVGKTSTKQLLARALRATGQWVWATPGNLNNRVGVPMTLLMLDEGHGTAVIEMGTSEQGEIATLAEIARPNVGVVTRVSRSHTAGIGTLEDVAHEKGAMFRALPRDGVAVGYIDDEHVRRALGSSPPEKRIGYGTDPAAVVRLSQMQPVAFRDGVAGAFAEVSIVGDAHALTLRVVGEGALLNAAAALAVVRGLDLDVRAALAALAEVTAPEGRMHIREADGLTIIDDTYNASPSSMRLAIDTAASLAKQQGTRLVAVLGDMKELGAGGTHDHRVVGAQLALLGVDVFIACGELMASAADEARSGPNPVAEVRKTRSSESAAYAAVAMVRTGDVVLVKGSRSMRMERVVNVLLGVEAAA